MSVVVTRFAERVSGHGSFEKSVVASLTALAIVTIAIEIPATFLGDVGDPVRYFVVDTVFNAVRMLGLGAVVGAMVLTTFVSCTTTLLVAHTRGATPRAEIDHFCDLPHTRMRRGHGTSDDVEPRLGSSCHGTSGQQRRPDHGCGTRTGTLACDPVGRGWRRYHRRRHLRAEGDRAQCHGQPEDLAETARLVERLDRRILHRNGCPGSSRWTSATRSSTSLPTRRATSRAAHKSSTPAARHRIDYRTASSCGQSGCWDPSEWPVSGLTRPRDGHGFAAPEDRSRHDAWKLHAARLDRRGTMASDR